MLDHRLSREWSERPGTARRHAACDRGARRYRSTSHALLLMLSLNATAALGTVGSRAFAQTDEQRAAARSLATDGAAAFNEGRYKESVDYFTRAESLVHAPPHLLFSARALEKLGLLVKAREHYLKVVKETLPPTAPQAFRDAQTAAAQELAKVEPRIGSLTLQITGAEQAKDLQVQVDGVALPAVLIGVARPTDPGEHIISLSAPGYKAYSETVKLSDGEKKAVTLALQPDANAALPAPPPVEGQVGPSRPAATSTVDLDTSATAPPSSGQALKIGGYVGLGVGVVGLGLGTVFLLNSRSKRADADSAFAQCNQTGDCRENDTAAQRTADLDDQARSAQTISTVGFVVGALGIAAGTTMLVLGNQRTQSGLLVQPYVALGRAGVSGSF
ncbi:MAG TPA: PEGA domain-containing protein [Polyangiaceae bacterium]|nr:PEGA domain-containing protein [Polyangiaceae bacterium]